MAHHAVGELGLEPGRLRRHDEACIGHRHQVGHLRRIEREGERHLARLHPLLKSFQAARAADEIDALIAALVQPADNLDRCQIPAGTQG